jgi:predicted membrane protein
MGVLLSVYATSLSQVNLLLMLCCYMFQSYDHHQAENILITRVTQLTTDPLFYNIANIIVIVFYI